MALCLAHATGGWLAYEAVRPAGPHRPRLLVAAIVLGNAPDLDFLPGMLAGDPMAYHRGVTHTVAAVLVAGLAAWALGRAGLLRGAPPAWWALFAAGAWGSHLAVDWLTADAVPPEGAAFLWPLLHAHLHAPFSLFGEIVVDSSSPLGFVRSLLTPVALAAWARDAATAGAVVAAVAVLRAARRVPARVAVGSARVPVLPAPEALEQVEP